MSVSVPPQGSDRSAGFLRPAVAIFCFALVVRLIHVWQLHGAPFFDVMMGDAESYDAWAKELAGGQWLGTEVFYQAPLYPYFLGVVYTLFGSDPLVSRLVQAVIGASSCVFIALAGRRLFSRPAGFAAGVMLAVYAPAIFYDGLVQKSVLDLFFLSVSLWLMGCIIRKPGALACWGLGLTMGCLTLTRENALVFVVILIGWLLWQYRDRGSQRWAFAGAFVLGLILVLTPVAVRNKVIGGEFHLTTSQFGPNFYMGNNEHATGRYVPLRFGRGIARHERQDAIDLAEQATGRTLSPAEVSKFWSDRAFDYIASQPVDWLKLMVTKFALVWDATEDVDTEDLYTFSRWSIPLRIGTFICHFGIIAPLAIVGVWITWSRRKDLWPLYVMTVLFALSVVAFHVYARFRFPLVPFLVLFASAGLIGFPGFLRQRSGVVACLFVASAMAVFSNWPMTPRKEMGAVTFLNLGSAMRSRGDLDAAVEHYQEALRIKPEYAEGHYNLANTLKDQGELEQAIHHYREAIRIHPSNAGMYNNLASALQANGHTDEAIETLGKALEINPDAVTVHHNLGAALLQQGRTDEAITHFREALRINPSFEPSRTELDRALRARRRP